MSSDGLRKMTSVDLELVLAWRNHDDVRRYMYTTHLISSDEHVRWFNRTKGRDGVSLLIYEVNGSPKGFVSFTASRCKNVADWGFYLAPDVPKGTGNSFGKAALQYAFEELSLHKLCGEALGFNARSIRFHEKLGFFREGVLRDQHFNGDSYVDVLCFGLLFSEWKNNF